MGFSRLRAHFDSSFKLRLSEKLLKAVVNNEVDEARHYIYCGADVNMFSEGNQSVLLHASVRGCIDTVILLLKKKAFVNSADKRQRTALMFASFQGHAEIVKLLIQSGADINAKDYHGRTALAIAASKGYGAVVKMLIEARADLNNQDIKGRTALMEAAARGYCKIVALLLKANALVDIQNESGLTALMFAAHIDNINCLELLLDRGADIVLCTNIIKATVYFYARTDAAQQMIEQSIFKRHAQVEAHLGKDCASVVYTYIFCPPPVLLNQSSDEPLVPVSLPNPVITREQKNTNDELLSAIKSKSPLHIVSHKFDQGVSLDARTREGQTPLMLAVIVNAPSVVDFLLEQINGSSNPASYLNMIDAPPAELLFDRQTALDWAKKLKRDEIVKKLVAVGAL